MPRYTVEIVADHTGTAHRIEIDAATPWLALEKSHDRYRWLSAEVFDRGKSLGRVDHLTLPRRGLWQVRPSVTARPAAQD